MTNVGPTGQLPEGKLNKDDQGELALGIAPYQGHVLMNFGKEISWIAMQPEQAEQVGRALIVCAAQVKGGASEQTAQ